MRQVRILLLIGMIALSAGCSASITRHGYEIDASRTVSSCTGVIIKKNAALAQDAAEVLGMIVAKDSGFSASCSEFDVLSIFIVDACSINAHMINIVEEDQPDFWSTCYRAKAELIKVKDPAMLSDVKSDPQYTPELIQDRSKITKARNRGMFVGGVLGGAVGGAIGAATY